MTRYEQKYGQQNRGELETLAELEVDAKEVEPKAEALSTKVASFFGKPIMQFFVGNEVLETQKENWARLISNAERISESQQGNIAPHDPTWMRVHGLAYQKYITDLSAEHPDNIMQDLYAETFEQSVTDVKDSVKQVVDSGRMDFKIAIAGLALLVVFQVLNMVRK